MVLPASTPTAMSIFCIVVAFYYMCYISLIGPRAGGDMWAGSVHSTDLWPRSGYYASGLTWQVKVHTVNVQNYREVCSIV